jgi:hypothetical protein
LFLKLQSVADSPVHQPARRIPAQSPDIKEKLLKGYQAGAKTFKVHQDGYNQLPYLTGEQAQSPRREFFYFNDDGDLVALRYENWKVVFMASVITSKPAIRYHFKTGQRTSLRTLRCCTVPVVIPARVFSIGGDPAGAPQGDRARGISAERFEIPLAGGGALFAPWGEPSPPRLAPGGNGKGGSDSLLPQADFLVRYFMTPLAIG